MLKLTSIRELIAATDKNTDQRWIYMIYTDHVLLQKYEDVEKIEEMLQKEENKLLEVRVFSNEAEYKAFRSDIGSSFTYRVKEDEDTLMDYYDESHFLEDKSGKICVRNYLSYYESGQAYVSDWRLVRIERGE